MQVLGYLTRGVLQFNDQSSWQPFVVFATFVMLLLGYVFIGGFRAVLASDVWQYKILQSSLLITVGTFLLPVIDHRTQLDWQILWKDPGQGMAGFYFPVVLVNLIAPLGLGSSWQRFRAFGQVGVDFKRAVTHAIIRTSLLWSALITASLCLALLATQKQGPPRIHSLIGAFSAVQNYSEWCQYVIFPLLLLAALSAMYSTSDTCVSALLYLIAYPSFAERLSDTDLAEKAVSRRYFAAMAAILGLTILLYWFLRGQVTEDITATPLFKVAIAFYASLSVIAPTLFLLTILRPVSSSTQARIRSKYLVASLVCGSAAFWACTTLGFNKPYSLWGPIATLPALSLSILPAWWLYRIESRSKDN
jgi:hypothetical protein